jgi:hypothetical protein
MLCSKASYSVNDTEATSYAYYDGVDGSNVSGAQLIAILAGADKDGQSKFFFNGQEYTGFGMTIGVMLVNHKPASVCMM